MAGWSIRSAVIAVALASTASAPALAQQSWAPPPSDDGWQQTRPADDAAPGYDAQDGANWRDDRWSTDDDYASPSDQQYGDDASDRSADAYDSDSAVPNGSHGGFASRDALPPGAMTARPAPRNEENGWDTWHSRPPQPEPNATPEDHSAPAPATLPEAQRNGWPAPSGPAFTEPETMPGYQASIGIDNRSQAVSACLAAVRDRVGGAGAARVDGINGDWMVSGAIADGRAFYCSIRHGAIDDVQFGS